MASEWVKHVQKVYAAGKKSGMSYSAAMKKASASWKGKKGAAAKDAPAKKKRGTKAKKEEDEKEEPEAAARRPDEASPGRAVKTTEGRRYVDTADTGRFSGSSEREPQT